MPIIIEITARKTADKLLCDPKSLNLKEGDDILINTDDGLEHGRVIKEEHFREFKKGQTIKIYEVVRKLTEEDQRTLKTNDQKSKDAFRSIANKIEGLKLNMNLSCCEYIFDCGKIYVYYTSDSRVDFRELIKDLGHMFKTRIQMVQIGVRDEARLTGDCGPCGNELCCKKFISDFKPVTIDMVKDQNLQMNPGKLSGICGRLMCCMSFEIDCYRQQSKKFPKVGDTVKIDDETWTVRDLNLVSGNITLRTTEGKFRKIDLETFQKMPNAKCPQVKHK